MIDFLKQTFGDAVTEDIMKSFKTELGKKFVAKADFNAKRDELNLLKEQIGEYKTKAENADKLNQDLCNLQTKYDEQVAFLNGTIEQMKLEGELSSLIRKSGGKNEKAVRALLEIGSENPMEDATNQLEALKLSDPYLFSTPSPTQTKGNFPRNSLPARENLTYSQMMQLEANKNF